MSLWDNSGGERSAAAGFSRNDVAKTYKVAAPLGTSEVTPGNFGPDHGDEGTRHRRPKRSGGGRGRSGGAATSRARRPDLWSEGLGRQTAVLPGTEQNCGLTAWPLRNKAASSGLDARGRSPAHQENPILQNGRCAGGLLGLKWAF